MRVSMTSIVLAGAVLALGACSASVETVDLTLAERAEQCSADSELVRTGSQTGDTRQDYRCRSGGHRRETSASSVNDGGANRISPVDRSLRRGY